MLRTTNPCDGSVLVGTPQRRFKSFCSISWLSLSCLQLMAGRQNFRCWLRASVLNKKIHSYGTICWELIGWSIQWCSQVGDGGHLNIPRAPYGYLGLEFFYWVGNKRVLGVPSKYPGGWGDPWGPWADGWSSGVLHCCIMVGWESFGFIRCITRRPRLFL